MIEHKIIKLLLQKKAFLYLEPYIYEKILPPDLKYIYQTIVLAHEKYDTDLTIEEIRLLHFTNNTLSEANKNVVNIILEKIEQAELPNESILKDITVKLSKQKLAQEALEKLSPIVLGKEDDFEPVLSLLNNHTFETTIDNITAVTTDIDTLLPLSLPENRYEFALPPLQELTLGAGPQNFIIVFGRPEIGKSTFVADNNIGYLRQGLRIAYFGNEEPGWKIMLNHIRSATGLSDKELQYNYKEKRIKQYEEWNAIKENFLLYDGVGMSITDLDNYIKSSNVNIVVVDQLDKISVKETYGAEHTRLKQVYVQAREIAKRNNILMIAVSQASAEAEGKRYVHFSMLDESKTGKPGEADIIIGIGKAEMDGPTIRTLYISKNKISGGLGPVPCIFLTDVCKVVP